MANPRVAWGIDIGNRALKAVKLVRTPEGVRIDDYDIIEHENLLSNAGDNRETLIQTALAVFQGKHNLKGLPAAVGVSGQQSFARFIKLPPVEEKQIPQIVKFEAIQQIPFPLDEVEWSYQLFRDEASPDIEVGIFAMRKELVNQHLGYFTSSGVNVKVVQMNPLAVYNALAYDEKLKGTTMIIDLGAENADLLIAEGESVWMRSIPIGGNHFTEALVRDFKLRFERAEELKRTTATSPHGRRILQAMRPVFADLVSEIQRSIGFYSSTHRDSRIARVIALGGTFKLPGLQKYLQQNLSLEVHKLDGIGFAPPSDAKLAATLSENSLSSASAYGLALQAIGDAKITSSLLPQSIQKEREWQSKTKWFAAAAAAFVVGSGIAFATLQAENSAYTQQDSARGEIDQVLDQAKEISRKYKEVEGQGAADLEKIKQMKALADHRDVWPKLVADVDQAFPMMQNPVKPPANTPRSARQDVRLEDLEVAYNPAMKLMVEKDPTGRFVMADADFNKLAGKRDPNAMAGLRSRREGGVPAAPGAIAGPLPGAGPAFTVDGGGPVPFGPGVSDSPVAAVGGANDPGQKRGYLLTLHITTPNAGGVGFVQNKVVDALMALEKNRAADVEALKKRYEAEKKPLPPIKDPSYSLARISVSSAQQLKFDSARMQALIARAQAAQARKAAAQLQSLDGGGTGPGGKIDLRGFTPDGDPVGPGSPGLVPGVAPGILPPGFDPTGATQNPADLQAAQNALLVDPVTGEKMTEDWEMTILVAVVLDPYAAVAPPPPTDVPSEEPPPES